MKNFNLLLITVRSDFGGGPLHVNQLIEYLPDNINIFLACPIGEPYFELWRSNERINKIIKIPFRSFSISKFYSLIKFVKNNKISIVHSHGKGAGIYSRLLKVFCPSLKIVHTFHGLNNQLKTSKRMIYYGIEKVLCPFTDCFIAVSEGEKELALKNKILNLSKSRVIYNGITKPIIERNNTENKFVIITVARFTYQKNMSFAFDIAKRFSHNKDIQFLWVGDGEDCLELQNKAKEQMLNIEFTGFSKNPYNYMKNADIFLSTSRFEGLPYSLIEAISIGLPVIATDILGNNEIVKNGKNGFLFDTEDQAVEIIEKLYRDSSLRKTLSEGAHKIYDETFTLDKMVNNLNNQYFRLINNK